MKRKSLFVVLGALLATAVLFFEISINIEFALPGKRTVADLEQEARYEACYATRDDEIHTTAFGTIDNPDVQKEFITSNRAIAVRDCREQYPEQTMTEKTPFRFNLVDLEPRFW